VLRAGGVLEGLADPARVAVAGHSDGAVTALAVAYDRRLRDRRVRAAVIMSGAAIPPFASFAGPPLPALLATQGTADSTNAPRNTYALFRAAPRPKYLLRLIGADHIPPYTYQQPQLGLVERVTLTFLDAYLEGRPAALARLRRAGRRGVAALTASP
jgi:pimeloyl-ACP methyl ester carboxylesterase